MTASTPPSAAGDRWTCRHCHGSAGAVVLDLGRQPSAETFPDASSDPTLDPAHPLRMWLCGECRLAQLMEDPGTVEEQTVVVESQAMAAQAKTTLETAWEQGLLPPGARVLELGSPHGHPLTERLEARDLIALTADSPEPADVVLDVYGLLHEPDQDAALAERLTRVRPGGALVLQLHTLSAVLATEQFSELRHGHFAYWSLPALDGALRERGWGVHRARRFDYDAGTLVVIATADPDPDPATSQLLDAELEAGVTDADLVAALQQAADVTAGALRAWLVAERDAGRVVLGYGAAGRSVPLLCHAHVDATLLPLIADAAPTKHGRRLPSTDIAIAPPAALLERHPDRVLLFLPDLLDEVRRSVAGVEDGGGSWVLLTPEPVVVNREERVPRPPR